MTAGSAPRLGDPLASVELVDDPYPFLARLRREAPVWRVPGSDAFLVSTWELVAETAGPSRLTTRTRSCSTRSRPARGLRGT